MRTAKGEERPMKITRRETLNSFAIAAAASATPFALIPPAAAQPSEPLSPDEARAIAREVFFWGMHPVGIYHLRYNSAQNDKSPRFGGVNRLHWDRKPMLATDHSATTPNATTLYGSAILDLAKEPVVIIVPEIQEHYWSVQFVDNYARWWPMMIGSQFNAPGPLKRLLIGPNWSGKMPSGFFGAEIAQSPSDFACALGRVALTDDTPEELTLVNGIQDGITLMSLSAWEAAGRKSVRPDDVPVVKGDYPTYPGMENVREPGKLKGVEFLRWVSLVLNDPTFTKQEDGYKERTALPRFEKLGLKAGVQFDPSNLSVDLVSAIDAGIDEGRKEATQAFLGQGRDMKGWRLSTDLGYKDTDWVMRAGYGFIALLAPVPSRSHVGALGVNDSQGRPLTGENRYTLTFDLNDMPPVTEFWEIPLYDRSGYFVENPINRYSLNSYMMKRGKLHAEGGKLVIHIQNDEPENSNQRKNWLPAPKIGGFQFAVRFYGPGTPLIDGSYNMPGVVRTEK
jgi:hypothetical protein